MKQLSTSFVLSNILTSILLVFSANQWKSFGDSLNGHGTDFKYGLFLYIVVIVGGISSALKARHLAHHSKNKFTWWEQLLLFVLYVFAMGGFIFLLMLGVDLMFDPYEQVLPWIVILVIPPLLASFILLILESFYFQYRPKKDVHPILVRLSNIGSGIYVSVGITVLWNAVVFGTMRFTFDLWGILQLCGLMLIFVFPFQRLFWYEVFGEAETRIDHLKVFGSILLVILCGVLPKLWVG